MQNKCDITVSANYLLIFRVQKIVTVIARPFLSTSNGTFGNKTQRHKTSLIVIINSILLSRCSPLAKVDPFSRQG